MVCPHGQGGLSQCGHFADKGGRGSSKFFAILCVRPLWRPHTMNWQQQFFLFFWDMALNLGFLLSRFVIFLILSRSFTIFELVLW